MTGLLQLPLFRNPYIYNCGIHVYYIYITPIYTQSFEAIRDCYDYGLYMPGGMQGYSHSLLAT